MHRLAVLLTWLESHSLRDSAWSFVIALGALTGGVAWFTSGGPLVAGVLAAAGVALLIWLWE